MSISLLMHGYVVGRGRGELAGDPTSGWNKKTVSSIIALSNKINALTPDLLAQGFNVGNLFAGTHISVLRNIWFETDTYRRPRLRQMLQSMRADSNTLQGTIIVESVNVFLSDANDHSTLEQKYVRSIVDGAIALVELRSESVRKFVSNDSVSVSEVNNLIRDAADNRVILKQRLQGIASTLIAPTPLEETENETSGQVVALGDQYKPVPIRDLFD